MAHGHEGLRVRPGLAPPILDVLFCRHDVYDVFGPTEHYTLDEIFDGRVGSDAFYCRDVHGSLAVVDVRVLGGAST